MHTRFLPVLSCALLAFLAAGCDTGDPFAATEGRPAIPIPATYEGQVPEVSEVLVVAEAPAQYFEPLITQYTDSLNTLKAANARLVLVNAGAAADVAAPYLDLEAAELPRMQFIRYWKRLGAIETYAGGSTTTIERSITEGVSQTDTQTFTESLSIEAESSAGGLFASASVKVSASFTATQKFSSTTSTETTSTRTFSVSPVSGTNMTYSVWQLVEEFRFVDAAGELYDATKYDFDAKSLRFVFPTEEIVPISACYAN